MSEHNIRALAVMLEKAATFVVGKPPNPKLSDRKKGELRYGSKGNLSIDLNNARWYDRETSEGGNATESRTRQVRPRASALPRAGDVGSTAAPHNGCS